MSRNSTPSPARRADAPTKSGKAGKGRPVCAGPDEASRPKPKEKMMDLIGKMVQSVTGEWVLVIDVWDNVVTTDRGFYHITKLMLSTAE